MDQTTLGKPQQLFKDNIAFAKPAITVKELKSVLDCIFRDEIASGKVVEKLEAECSVLLGFKHSLVLPSLHSAYHLALLAVDLKEGDEVIIPSVAPLAALDAIGYFKATPIIIDIAKDSFHPNLEIILQKVNLKTKVILLPYRFGSFKNYAPLYEALGKLRGTIKLIEDISEIPGSTFAGQAVGIYSDITLLSLEETMPVTMGKGSVLLTNSKLLYKIASDLRNPTKAIKLSYRVRYDYTITDYQAAMGIEQISKLFFLLKQRKKIAKRYLQDIKKSQFKTFFCYPESDGYGSFPIISTTSRKETISYFKKRNVETREVMTSGPLHRLLELSPLDFPNTERLYEKAVLLPIYPHLTRESVDAITHSFKRMCNETASLSA